MQTSIIIPVINEAAQIRECIASALAASPKEVIVVDGGSTDDSVQIASGCECKVLQSPPGRAVQQNLGATQATGDVLLFLHADCRLAADALSQIETALNDSEVVAGAFRQSIDAGGAMFRILEFGNASRVRWLKSPYGDQGIFVRRGLFEELGSFPEVRLMEDVLLMRQLRRHGRVLLLPGPITVSARRWQQHGILRQTLRNWCILIAERLGVSPDRLAEFYCPQWKPVANSESGSSP